MKKVSLLFLIGFLWRISMSFQGFDHVDLGFCNTYYQVFFDYPDSNAFNFIYYLLGLVGGLWEKLFGQFGIIGFRVLEAITLSGAIGLLYATFRQLMPVTYNKVAIALSFLFPLMVVTFHYNTFSFLLIAASVFCFSRSIRSNKSYWLFFSGVAIGLAFFVRMVNVSLSVLLLIPLIVYSRRTTLSVGIRKTLSMFWGIITGVAIVVLIMLALHQEQYFVTGFNEALTAFTGDEATHSQGQLFVRYFKSFKNIILQILCIFVIWYAFAKNQQCSSKYKKITTILLAVVFTILAYTSMPYLTLLAVCTTLVIIYLVKRATFNEGYTVCAYLLLAVLVYPLGSDIGIQGVFHWNAGLLIFPATYCLYSMKSENLRKAVFTAYICVALCCMVRVMLFVYDDIGWRANCLARIHSPRLNVLTSEKTAYHYNLAIPAIETHLTENRLLFIANQASELYYATNSLPFTGHVQTIIYTGDRLIDRLNDRLRYFHDYPLIVFLAQDNPSTEVPEVQATTLKWMGKHDYRLVYDDGFTRLYKNK